MAYCATCDGEFFAEMEPEELVATLDFRYLTDALTPQEAIEILRAAQEGKAERIAHLKEVGYPGYSTAAGWLGYSDEKMVRLAKQETEVMDFKQIKLKVGQNLEDDLRRLKLAREAVGPDIAIAVDANQVWDVPQAIEWIGKFKDYDLAWVEEPTCPDDVLGHAAIQKAIERMGPSPAVAAWTASNAPMPHTMSNTQALRLISSAVCMWKSTRTIRHWKTGCCPKTMILCCWQHLCGPPSDRPWRMPLYAHGVREPLHTPASPRGRCLQDDFIRGLQLMADKNMPFDACVRVDELDDLAQACEQVPEATVIVDHMGNIFDLHNLESSSDALHRLGELPNVYVKVSGYPTDDPRFVSTLLDLAQAAFSNKRLLYASNWPVVGLYADFDSHLSILLNRFAGDDDFFLNNARNAYHIVERKIS